MKPPRLRDDSGFTLVEMMIAAAITIVIAFAIATLIVQMNRESAKTKVKAEAHLLLQQITQDLKTKPVDP